MIPSLTTTGRPSSSGSAATTIPVINGKIAIQVTSAILYGGGGGVAGCPGNVNQLSSPVTKLVWVGPIACGSARSTQAACSGESSQARRCSELSNR